MLGFLLLLVCLAAPAWGEKTLPAGVQGSTIKAIHIQGNKIIASEVILDEVQTRVGDVLIEEKIKNDMKTIYALGYFSDISVSFEAYQKGTKVVLIIKENPIISAIELSGNSVYSTAEISSLIKSKVGQLLDYKNIQDDIKIVEELYKKGGYILAKVIDIASDEKNGKLTIKIMEGVVESIEIQDNASTKSYVILRELETLVGTPLNESVLKNDLKRVFNLGFFSDVSPQFTAGSTPDKITLGIKVKESRTGSLNFGGGFGEREGWFGFTDLSINNLFGSGQGVLVRGQFGQQLQTYQFKYFYPWLWPEKLGKKTSFTGKRWYTIGKDIWVSQQNEIRNGWEATLDKPFSDWLKSSFSLGSEAVSPTSTTTFEPYASNTIGFSLSYDTRDFWLNPTEGAYYTLSFRQGWKQTSTSTTFTKYGLDLNQFYKLGDKQTLALRLDIGLGLGDVPLSELYWAGGPNTVRGYYLSEIHTGRRKIISNIEYRYRFNEIFEGVAFYDLGNAWETGTIVLDSFLSGKGIGVRINTPMGPIRLDYGIGKYRDWSNGVTHFSIGQAF